jgi:transposase
MSKQYKTYVGADLHKSFTYFIGQNRQGKEISEMKMQNNGDHFREYLAMLPQPVQTVVESTSNWSWFCEELRKGDFDTVVAHARETSAKSDTREKSDASDARLLATLLRGNLIRKVCWQAPDETRKIRERLRYMQFLSRHKTSFKNRIHAVLIQHNVQTPYKDAFCKKGRIFLRNIDLAQEFKTTIDRSLQEIENIESMLKEDLKYCEKLLREDEQACILTTMPGISVQLACMIRYETGDIERFQRHEQYVSYTGIVPGKRQSAEESRDIGITKEGAFWLRWAFMQAAQTADRQKKGRLSNYYWRQFRKTRNRNKAVTATAREMAVIAYYMMKRKKAYYDPAPCVDRA